MKLDVRAFEPKIQKLLDDQVMAMPAEAIIDMVNINDGHSLMLAGLMPSVSSRASLYDQLLADDIAAVK